MAVKGFKKLTEQAEQIVSPETTKKRTGAFDGMLNDVSKSEKQMEEVLLVPIENIIPNELNEEIAGMSDIEELASNIDDIGLQQSLVGYPIEGGKWKLLTGHRRLEACKLLVEQGDNRFKRLPVVEQKPSDLDLPIDEELKEKYLMISTNVENRTNYSPQERMAQYEALKKIYEQLEKAGKKPKGRRREIIANEMKMPPMSVSRYEEIDKKAVPKVKKEFKENEMDLTATTALAKEEPEVQTKALAKAKKEAKKTPEKKVTKALVMEAIKEVKEQNELENNFMNAPVVEDGKEVKVDIIEEFEPVATELTSLRVAFMSARPVTEDEYKVIKRATDKLVKLSEEIRSTLSN